MFKETTFSLYLQLSPLLAPPLDSVLGDLAGTRVRVTVPVLCYAVQPHC